MDAIVSNQTTHADNTLFLQQLTLQIMCHISICISVTQLTTVTRPLNLKL